MAGAKFRKSGTTMSADRPANIAMSPHGLFATIMERMNTPAYRLAVARLEPTEGQAILEIGFGTGKLLEMLADIPRIRLAGVDPTPAMVKRATARARLAQLGARLDLRQGSDHPLPWPDDAFHHVVAVHSFQFWPDPIRSLTEIIRVLKPRGTLVLILRNHGQTAPDWLPNPISRSGDEAGRALAALEAKGFDATLAGRAGSSSCLVARSPAERP